MSKCRFRTWTEQSDTRTESLNLYGIFLLYMVVVILKITKRKINLDFNFLFTSLVAQMVKNPSVMQGLIPGLGRSPGGGHDNSFRYSCLENPHGQRSLAGCSPWGCRVGHNWMTKHSTAQAEVHKILMQFIEHWNSSPIIWLWVHMKWSCLFDWW